MPSSPGLDCAGISGNLFRWFFTSSQITSWDTLSLWRVVWWWREVVGCGDGAEKWSSRSFKGISHLGASLPPQIFMVHCFLLALYHHWYLVASPALLFLSFLPCVWLLEELCWDGVSLGECWDLWWKDGLKHSPFWTYSFRSSQLTWQSHLVYHYGDSNLTSLDRHCLLSHISISVPIKIGAA